MLLAIAPLLAIDRSPALTVTVPAAPVPEVLVEMKPLLAIDKSPAAVTVTVPALPLAAGAPALAFAPRAALEISPLARIVMLPAVTLMVPALPLLPACALATIPVADAGFAEVPSIVNPPATVTAICPPAPEPNGLAAMKPLVRIVSAPCPGPVTETETLPAGPEEKESLAMPPDSASVTVPAVTETAPPLPGPEVLLEIWPLSSTFRVPAFTITLPALPLLPL